jgi:HSP90 family molecular chaperone
MQLLTISQQDKNKLITKIKELNNDKKEKLKTLLREFRKKLRLSNEIAICDCDNVE